MQNQRSKIFKLMACAIIAVAMAAHAQSRLSLQPGSGGAFATFDMPGAGTFGNQGTIPRAINLNGKATGYYIDASWVYHGFVIGLDGNYSTFDAPGAGTGYHQGTLAYDIARDGTIVGWLFDKNNVPHGFLRDPAPPNTITVIDTPLESINSGLETAGSQPDANGAYHGYVRSPDGVYMHFDAPGAGTGSGQGTLVCPGCLNDLGDVVGQDIDNNNVRHGFRRDHDGGIVQVDVPGAVQTLCSSINNQGQSTGVWMDANNVQHGYIRNGDGSFTILDAPGAGTSSGQGTTAENINNLGVVAGSYVDSANISHGFVRSAAGIYKVLDAPGAGTRRGDGTQGGDNTDSGLATGAYIDNNAVNHGYIWISLQP